MALQEYMRQALEKRADHGMLRQLKFHPGTIDFFSNDYLGLAGTPHSLYVSGATGSRLISGNSAVKMEVEHWLAGFYNAEAALIFNSGYDANLGLIAALSHRQAVVLYDELCHASIRDGIRLGLARAYSFRHNDVGHLRQLLEKAKGKDILVITESIFSMDGDRAPLRQIFEVAENYGAGLVVDEAHAAGMLGPEGRGLCQEVGIQPLARVVTFGKALGCHGASVLGGDELMQYLVNFARPFIYSTALPDAMFAHIRQMHQQMHSMDNERHTVTALRREWDETLRWPTAAIIPSGDHIIGLLTGSVEHGKLLERELLAAGISVKAILSPTVPVGFERLRISLHAFNTPQQIHHLCTILSNLCPKEYL
jgi:8-amino-7-oxononanoate synthase